MHEFSLIHDLMTKIASVAREQGATSVSRVKVWLGALSHISADHFREHFEEASRGTVAEGARLDVDVSDDESDPRAQEIVLASIDVDES